MTWPLRPASGKKLDPRFAVNVERKHEATANNPIHLIITIVLEEKLIKFPTPEDTRQLYQFSRTKPFTTFLDGGSPSRTDFLQWNISFKELLPC